MRLEIPLCPFFRWRNGDREVNWFTHSHRAFKVWHLRLKSSFVWLKVKFLTYFSTLEFITNSPRRTHCERVYHIERASHTGARAPNPYPTGSCPSQDSWCGEVTHSSLFQIHWAKIFLGLAAERVLTGSISTGYWGMSWQRPCPHHCPHQHTVTNRKEHLLKFPWVAEAELKAQQALGHLILSVTCQGRGYDATFVPILWKLSLGKVTQ